MTLENPYITKSLRPDRQSQLFTKLYAQLSVNKKNPGIIIPIFTFINNDYKLFGGVTLNGGGSVSFFPDFYKLNNFDHLTLSADFIKKKGHLTKIETDGKHRKIIDLEAVKASNHSYILMTFGMNDDVLLMDSPPEIELPSISYTTEEQRSKYNSWIDKSAHGICILDFPEGKGSYFIQLQVIPKSGPEISPAVETTSVENLLAIATPLEGEPLMSRNINIPTPDKSDFSLRILTFRVDKPLKGPFCFNMAKPS